MERLIYIAISCFLLSSCAVRSVYVPTSQNVTLFDNKKQVQANAYIGANHLELQLAHNPINHLITAFHVNYGTGLSSYWSEYGIFSTLFRKGKYEYAIYIWL